MSDFQGCENLAGWGMSSILVLGAIIKTLQLWIKNLNLNKTNEEDFFYIINRTVFKLF